MKVRQSETLDRQLESYAAIAWRRRQNPAPAAERSSVVWKRFAAATGASLAGVAAADAAINHVTPATPIRVAIPANANSDVKFVDLNNDAVNDLQLGALVSAAYTYYGYRYIGSAQGVNGLLPIGAGGGLGKIRRFANNDVIPPTTPSSVGNLIHKSATSLGAIMTTLGEWDVNDTAIAGFVFGPAGAKRAGWLQIRTKSASNGTADRLLSLELLQWAYQSVPGVSIMAGQTSVAGIPGDYNNNGTVGTEDYNLWKSTFGQNVTAGTSADGNGNAKVDAADYTVWRDHKNAAGSGSLSGAVPEPSTVTLGVLALGAAGVAALRRRSN